MWPPFFVRQITPEFENHYANHAAQRETADEERARMAYLETTEYESYGLAADTTDDWIAVASGMIDAHCRRVSVLTTRYMERLRVVEGSQTVRLSYLPLVALPPATIPLVMVRGRYTRPRRGEVSPVGLDAVVYAFSLPGAWTQLDPASIDFASDTGELTLPYNVLGLPYSEVEVTYTAGCAVVPEAVKIACAQLVKNAQTTPGLNVKSSKMDTMQMQYFSNSLMDAQVQQLLRPYVATRLG
jgi:hypothetical protein